MLESLSSLEGQRLNYVELHAVNAGIKAEKLDNMRITVAKDSPMWETLDLCLKAVDTKSLDLLVPRLAHMVRSGVGLNTRVGVASFISMLVQKVSSDIKPFTSMLLKLLFPAVVDEKSGAAKRAFAGTCAVILKHAASTQAQKLIEDTAALHTGDRNAQISCAILLKNFTHHAGDVVSGFHATIFPVTFVARFEDDKDVSGIFEELWDENTSSERITLQLYAVEIVALLCEGIMSSSAEKKKKKKKIMSSSWSSKKKSAKAIRKLSDVLGESLSPHYHVLLEPLLKEVPGRLWEGKDALLDAIAALCTSCHKAISAENSSTPNAILSIVSSACSKKAKAYREAAFTCLQQVIKAFGNPEFFGKVFPLLYEVCSQAVDTKPGQSHVLNDATKAGEDKEDVSAPYDKVLECITSCISVAPLPDIFSQGKDLIHVYLFALSPGLPWTVKFTGFSSIKELSSKLHPIAHISQDTTMHAGASSLIHEVHISASECLLDITKLYKIVTAVQEKDDSV